MIRKILCIVILLSLTTLCYGQIASISNLDDAYLKEMKAENEALSLRIKTFPAEVQEFNKKVAQAIRNQDYALALNLTCSIDSLYPNIADIRHFKGKMLFKNGNPEAAALSINEAITLNPKNKWYYITAAGALAESNKTDIALKTLDKLIALFPDWSIGYNVKAAMLHHLGQNTEALKLYNIAVKTSPKSAQILTNRGDLYLFMGEKGLALKDYEQALIIQPDYTYAIKKIEALK